MPNIDVRVTPSFKKVGDAFKLIKLGAALQRGITAFAYLIERESKKVTPVDTGRLRASIATDIGNLRAVIAPHTKYAVFVHEGTRYMKARPFMEWGASKAEQKKDKFITNEVKKEISAVVKRLK